jgi:hypothetical protein
MTAKLDLKIFPIPTFADGGSTKLSGLQLTGALPAAFSSLLSSRIADHRTTLLR